MTPDYNLASAYIQAIAGDPNAAVIDWRVLHDKEAGAEGYARRGTLAEHWQWLCNHNALGYGVFANVAALDGQGRSLANVDYLRAHYIDLDGADAQQQYERAAGSSPAPTFAVQSSPGKYHVYWCLNAFYRGNDRFTVVQRKLRQFFNGDKKVIDATRVMRVPGFLHCKGAPHLVTCHALPGFAQRVSVEQLEAWLEPVNIIDGGSGGRKPLGTVELAAPNVDWLQRALDLTDPNSLDRGDWIAFSAGWKQAGWTLLDPDALYARWSAWCERYTTGEGNNPAENLKQWKSLNDTELGWPSILRRTPALNAANMFGSTGTQMPQAQGQPMPGVAHVSGPLPVTAPAPRKAFGEYLTPAEQQEWFAGCTYVVNMGEMLCPDGRFLGVGKFNSTYGGKKFVIDSEGKTTNKAWDAATNNTQWRIPTVDHVRFLPEQPHLSVVVDDLGRAGVNVYKPANIRRIKGNVEPFLAHLRALLPDVGDQTILLEYMAHNVKFPGFKIPWAPLIQSAEGAGKGAFKRVMRHAMGKPYVYFPKAAELAASGAKFNAWLRNKLFILVDEIKVDERRELIEVLKPLISEEETEIQAKGLDQELEDNFSNWFFFSNYKDAIPIDKNGRRYAIMFSPLQTLDDMLARGMNQTYFDAFYAWLDCDGAAVVTDYLMSYPIERGAIPKRAPQTSSTAEALALSVSPIERAIKEAVEDGLAGFRGGWLSSIAIAKRVKDTQAARGNISPTLIGTIVERMGYRPCGRAARGYFAEGGNGAAVPERAYLWHLGGAADVSGYGRAQGWE